MAHRWRHARVAHSSERFIDRIKLLAPQDSTQETVWKLFTEQQLHSAKSETAYVPKISAQQR